MFKKLFAVAAFSVVASAAFAQTWPNLPEVGGSAYSCGSVNGVSNCTVSAGPSALTGNETIPGDTNLSQGRSPQTVKIPSSLFATGGLQVVTTNASVVLADNISMLVSDQTTATIALINLPVNPKDNQVVRIANAGAGVLTITSIAVGVGSGHSIVDGAAPATLAIQTTGTQAAVSNVAYVFQASSNTWFRIM